MANTHKIFSVAAVLIALGIITGAFGAHGLKGHVEPVRFEAYQTAVFYHLLNALGLLVLAVSQKSGIISQLWLKRIATLLILGIVLFSGSLYLLVIFDLPFLGAITPFGGSILIIGWSLTAFAADRSGE